STSTPSRSSRARNATSSATGAHACSPYSRPGPPSGTGPVPGARLASAARTAWSRTRIACAASPPAHPPLASTRTLAPGRAWRTAATRATSSTSSCPSSATLTLTVVQPGNRSRTPATSPAATAGTVAVTAARRRRGGGRPRPPIPRAGAVAPGPAAPGRRRAPPPHLDRGPQPVDRLRVRILGEGPELPPAGRALDQRHLALGDAPEPHVHRQRHHVHPPEKIVDRVGARNGCHGSTLTSDP